MSPSKSNRGLGSVVRVRDQVSYSQSLKIMQEADVLPSLDSPGRRVGVPAKLYEYFASGCAVLGLAETDGAPLAFCVRAGSFTSSPGPPTRMPSSPVYGDC